MNSLDKDWLLSIANDESIIPFTIVDRRKLRLLAEIALANFDGIVEEVKVDTPSTDEVDDSAVW